MLSFLANYERLFGPLRVLGYETFRVLLAAVTAG